MTMSIDLTGITNQNEYYTNHYFSTVFEENASAIISKWNVSARETKEGRTPWSLLRQNAKQYYVAHDRFVRSSINLQILANIKNMADHYLQSLGYPEARPEVVAIDESISVPVYLEMTKSNGAPWLWVLLSAAKDSDAGIMESCVFNADDVEDDASGTLYKGILSDVRNEELITRLLFGGGEAPRFVMLVGMNQIALIDRNKWNEKRYLQFELEEIFSRLENTTLQAMSVLLHRESLCPDDGQVLLDELDEQSQKNASGVSQDLKYALRESIELLGNEVLYDMSTRLGRDLTANPVDAGQLTLECLRYMYRMLFVLFIESRPELGYAPIKAHSYYCSYSLESLRDIADNIREDVAEVGDGYYLHETLSKLYELIYNGYPKTEAELKTVTGFNSLHDMFIIPPLKAHIFDPEYTKLLTAAKLRNSCMLRIIDLMSVTTGTGKKNARRGRISYANLGINQMGAVYEALLSYRGFIAEQDLYEVKKAGDKFNELDVGYFVTEAELGQYTEAERVRYEHGEKKGKLRRYEKGTFIYRLAGREREKSASYYTPEVLTKCLVKYALKELLAGKTADEILALTICEPAMGSAAFLNEAINQLAEAYISRKEKENGEIISYEKRFNELQKVKMYIADRNVYGIDLNPVAVELAEVSLWLNTIYEGGFVPWFGTQLVNGNSLIGARRQVYRIENAKATSKGMRWYELEPERLSLGTTRADKGYKLGRKQIYHFLLGDPGMCSYSDKVIKKIENNKIKMMESWRESFIDSVIDDDIDTLLRLSRIIDELWDAQVKLRKKVEVKTRDVLSIYGHNDEQANSHTTIRQKDKIYSELYKSEHMKNAGPYARLKFAMDYWCALWFWPIEKAELLPTRSEFLFDMSLILEGTVASVNVKDNVKAGQLSLFPTEMEKMVSDIMDTYGTNTVVDIARLCEENPRLDLVAKIAKRNKFMHWELEFADLFVERGGFDLILGNPPWRVIEWKSVDVLGDINPEIVIHKNNRKISEELLKISVTNSDNLLLIEDEYISVAGMQSYMCSPQNYSILTGMKTDLYRCFLPLGWYLGNSNYICGYLHPDGVFDDANGILLREVMYTKLRKHFQFENQEKLFPIGNTRRYSINIYGSEHSVCFDSIFYLFNPKTVDECYENAQLQQKFGIKNDNGKWNKQGNKGRIVTIDANLLKSLVGIFDDDVNWKSVKLPLLFSKNDSDILMKFNLHDKILSISDKLSFTEMWQEPSSKDSVVLKAVKFPESLEESIFCGPNIGVGNPFFKTPKHVCNTQKAYDVLDFTFLDKYYLPRNKFSYNNNKTITKVNSIFSYKGRSVTSYYRLTCRKMIDKNTERTLISAVLPPKVSHMDSLYSFIFDDERTMLNIASFFSSILFDYYVKIMGKSNFRFDLAKNLPLISDKYDDARIYRTLLLNCCITYYADLWQRHWKRSFKNEKLSKNDERLNINIPSTNKFVSVYLSDYARRQLLIENDVLCAISLGVTCQQLCSAYRMYFPVLKQYEADTWYDANGRIVFTNNRSLVGVGYDRTTWENEVKGAPAGKKFYRTITDDTMPGGPIERTIEYVAPFDRCDREKDYETTWNFFKMKYGGIQ